MNTNLLNASDTTHEAIHETTVLATADCGPAAVLDLLATAGLAAEAVYDGDAEGCPHCISQVLSEAA
jgi:hypothetical protein